MIDKNNDQTKSISRRNFLAAATLGVGAATVGAAFWGLGQALKPSDSVTHEYSPTLDLKQIKAGTQQTLLFENRPVFVKHLTKQQVEDIQSAPLSDLPDKTARNSNFLRPKEATLENRSTQSRGTFVIVSGVCPRRGCVVLTDVGDYGGWFCPCGGAHFDVLGRVRKGPSTLNLNIPRYSLSANNILSLHPAKTGPSQFEIEQLIFGKT